MRHSEQALQVEDVVTAGRLRLRIARGKTDRAGHGAEIGPSRGRRTLPPVRCGPFEDWQVVAKRKAGPLFRRVSAGECFGNTALHPDSVRRILDHRVRLAGLTLDRFERPSADGLRVGFIIEA